MYPTLTKSSNLTLLRVAKSSHLVTIFVTDRQTDTDTHTHTHTHTHTRRTGDHVKRIIIMLMPLHRDDSDKGIMSMVLHYETVATLLPNF